MNKTEFQKLMEKGESPWLDWKADFTTGLVVGNEHADWDRDRARLMKSVVAIANSDDSNSGFLVYGVKDHKTHRELLGISKSFDDADFQQWFENTFDVPPEFIYQELEIELDRNVAIFEIHRTPSYPHVVKSNCGGILYRGQVWYRRGTKNTVALKAKLTEFFQGVQPFKIGNMRDPSLQMVTEHYEKQGRTLARPLFTDRDSYLSRGYELAYFPGTKREVWFGAHGDRYEHILLLKPENQ